ncbi:MAG: tRNA pseudouridine(55) synthase TruB [Candidatus Omnitrophica bacterium CG_4_9_14_0_2_um_filter_42_8]|nr:MAG: tRNA pseudouridine(55) synthase TruB [Candidatus Omnitrophica bacterium CG22_combo_CG10-13_8_21_14_all_43_16]PJC47482.1 MAG: tRNA pseudouridine(55) synthase TruB [Candidatus Omnitrophica bacterium CG_4_9_14_0_2_um_filter_42_8]
MDGILVVNKPSGITSHDVVDFIRRKFNIKRVGHAGTLDPLATGVLVMLLGKATKLSNTFLNDDKEYIAKLYFGKSTDTQDSQGKALEEKNIEPIDIEDIKKTLENFKGEIEQIPPMVSAIKYKGKKLYELARSGKTVAREPRKIKISEIEILDFKFPEITFKVKCSKGTYVRTLCEDIGRSLGVPSHMSGLVRSASGDFLLENSKNMEDADEKDIISYSSYDRHI